MEISGAIGVTTLAASRPRGGAVTRRGSCRVFTIAQRTPTTIASRHKKKTQRNKKIEVVEMIFVSLPFILSIELIFCLFFTSVLHGSDASVVFLPILERNGLVPHLLQ